MSSEKFHRIGLTGGIGAGKSKVAQLLKDAGVVVFNLDDIGREVTQTNPELAKAINATCGFSGTTVDRKKIREVLFRDPSIRAKIEALLHPLILKAFEKKSQEQERRGERLVVCEAALLVESGFHTKLDELLLVTAPESLRKKRLIARDHISETLADRILNSQTKEEQKKAFAHFIIENDKDETHLKKEVERLLERWVLAGWWKRPS